jgi:hypothetical protein
MEGRDSRHAIPPCGVGGEGARSQHEMIRCRLPDSRRIRKLAADYSILLLVGIWLVLTGRPLRADTWEPVYHPEVVVGRAAGAIRIDGDVDDPGWHGAAKASTFAEHNPGDQTRPDVDTEVLITYDDSNLYLAWFCYDDPAEVRASMCERDRIFSDDYVILCLDTFGEASLAYEISSNPYGVPGDLLFSPANGEDITYDINFESAGRITDFGWTVEMAIPFAGLRFPDSPQQVWRMDLWRNRPRGSRYQYSWAAYDRDETCWPCQWGTMRGITGVRPGSGLEFLPAVVAHQAGAMAATGFEDGNPRGDVGLGIAYDASSELTAEVTVNPDFSQVESDEEQIDVNTTFALFYPEARPFFQEGSDLFKSYFEAVYTRSINDPLVAGKVTWRSGGASVAVLSARDEHSVIILPFEERSEFVENGKSYSNILRARKDFGEQTHLGLVATDRRFDGGGSGSLLGVDGKIRFSKSNVLLFQALATHTAEVDNPALGDTSLAALRFDGNRYTGSLDGEEFWGHAFQVCLDRETRDYEVGADYWERSPTFRADNGFEPSNNSRRANVWAGRMLRFDKPSIFNYIFPQTDFGRAWNFDGVRKDEWARADLTFNLRAAQTQVHTQYLYSNELYRGTLYEGIWMGHACLEVHASGRLTLGGNLNYGNTIARHQEAMGRETQFGVWADVRPWNRLLVSVSCTHDESEDVATGENLFAQSVLQSSIYYQIRRELSARLVVQYNDRYDTWDVDPLLTYRINPLSIFYVGSTRRYENLNAAGEGPDGWTLTERQYFLKVQYLLQV